MPLEKNPTEIEDGPTEEKSQLAVESPSSEEKDQESPKVRFDRELKLVSHLLRRPLSSEEQENLKKRLESLGGTEDDLRKVEEAREKLEKKFQQQKDVFLQEFVHQSPDEMRHTINEHASFLATIPNSTSEDLEREFALDPETAELYFQLAKTFREPTEPTEPTETAKEGQKQDEESSEDKEVDGMKVGSLVKMSFWKEPRRVVEVIIPETPGGSSYVVVEGMAKPIITSDLETVLPKEDTENKLKKVKEQLQAKIDELNKAEEAGESDKILEAKLKEVRELENQKDRLENPDKKSEPEDAQENQDNSQETVKVVKTPEQILKEISLDNRNLIQKLPENTWKFFRDKILRTPAFVLKAFARKIGHKFLKNVGEVHRRYGFVGSRIGVLYNSALVDREKTGWVRYGTSLEGLQNKYSQNEELISEIKGSLEELKSEEEEIEEGALKPAILLKIKHTQERLNAKMKKALDKRQSLGNRLEEAKARVGIHEARRSVMVKELLEKIEPNIEPLLKDIEALKVEREKLSDAISKYSDKLDEEQAKLKETLEKMKKFPRLKSFLKDKKKVHESKIKRISGLTRETQSQATDIDQRLSNLNERANPWIEMRDKFKRIIGEGLDSETSGEEKETENPPAGQEATSA